jgi:single-stranded-DNA-specific exonuclease
VDGTVRQLACCYTLHVIYDEWVILDAPSEPSTLPIAARAIRNALTRRGINSEETYRAYAAPALGDLHDPSSIHGIAHACDRINRAIRDRETILIYGDYDVDGVTSIVLLQTVLRGLGADVDFVVPHRLVDGYGLKLEVLERVLVTKNVKLVITVDCGITSVEPVRRAIERGIDVIITDHHLPPGTLPDAAAVLNPKQPGCTYPFKELAGVGVVFKLCCALLQQSGRKMSIESLLKIAAIGTIADVAPLEGENRTIARLGLDGLSDPRNPGLRALIRRVGLLGKPLRASDVGFKLGPRLNAAGRLASANTAIELFAARSEEAAEPLVTDLERMNHERQQIELAVRQQAEEQIFDDGKVFVLAGEGWHKGVLGLAAGRIAQARHRPTLMIAIDGDRCVGSARSITTVNLHERLEMVSDLFTHFGGHEFACGFSLPAANLDELRERLEEVFDEVDEDLFTNRADVEAEVTLGELDREFLAGHEQLQPFGAANRQPLFLARDVQVTGVREFSDRCFELALRDSTGRASAVLWPSVNELARVARMGASMDVLFCVEPDGYSSSGLRLTIADAGEPGAARIESAVEAVSTAASV